MYTQKQIIDFISENRTFLSKNFHVSKIGLFGSYARNEQTMKSDIDLIIDFEKNTDDLFDLKIGIKKFFKENLNIAVDICREKYIKPSFKKRIEYEAIFIS